MKLAGVTIEYSVILEGNEPEQEIAALLKKYKGDSSQSGIGETLYRFYDQDIDVVRLRADKFWVELQDLLGKNEDLDAGDGIDPSYQKVDSLLGLLRELPPGGKPVR